MVQRARPKLKEKFLANLYKKWQEDFLHKTGMLCVSEVCDDILMWSHYASGHTGVCLEFAHILNHGLLGHAIPVAYADEFPEFDIVETFAPVDHSGARDEQALVQFGKVAFLTKSTHWKYEKEWRVVDFPVAGFQNYGFRKVNPADIRRIILGCRISDADRNIIVASARGLGPPPIIAVAKRKDRQFAIEIRNLV